MPQQTRRAPIERAVALHAYSVSIPSISIRKITAAHLCSYPGVQDRNVSDMLKLTEFKNHHRELSR